MLNGALRRAKAAGRMRHVRLSEEEFPNGKIWMK
jgi:hypothetical protein